MADRIIRIAEDFWTVRGTYRIFGLLNVGTQASLAALQSGGFVLLDSYTLEGEARDKIMELTDGGKKLEAVINLHPFHTVHVEAVAQMFPDARLYGTRRHISRFPKLRWESEQTESEEFAALYHDDFDFMVPRGVDFVAADEKLHFSSVLAFHRSSHTLHVDDTLNWLPLPWGGRLAFHPTLKSVLEDRPDAAADFRAWAGELAERCESVRHICTAHAGHPSLSDEPAGGIAARVRNALEQVESALKAHESRF